MSVRGTMLRHIQLLQELRHLLNTYPAEPATWQQNL